MCVYIFIALITGLTSTETSSQENKKTVHIGGRSYREEQNVLAATKLEI